MAAREPIQPQKSEVHATTADASGSPTAAGDEATTIHTHGRERAPHDKHPRVPQPPKGGTRIVRDDTDSGGPLVIQSGDPDLVRPQPPVDPFPTERKPEIDPPLDSK